MLEVIYKILHMTGKALLDFYKEGQQDQQIIADARKQQIQQQQQMQAEYLAESDYFQFSNVVLNCLKSNYKYCGLDCPARGEDIVFSGKRCSSFKRISFKAGTYIFRYVARRYISDLYIGGMKKQPSPNVETDTIKKILMEKLDVFAESAGYYFSDIKVADIGNAEVLIEIIFYPGVDAIQRRIEI